MKKLLFFITIFTLTSSIAQMPKLKQIENLEKSQIIIGLSGKKSVDESLVRMVNKFWDLCPISEKLPINEALAKAKNDDNLYVIYLDSYRSNSFTKQGNNNVNYKFVSFSKFVGLSTGKKKPIIYSAIPTSNDRIADEAIAHGTNFINQLFGMMLEYQVNASKALQLIKKNSTILNERVLYMAQWMVDNRLNEKEISKIYQGQFKIVSNEEWSQAILSKKEGIAYTIIIPAAVGGSYVYQHHICDAKTGQILGIKQPKAAFALRGGTKTINLSKGNKGFINKKNLKQYSDILKGK